MCASLLRQFKIRTCFFGAANERFGGTGGVLSIHSDRMGSGKKDGFVRDGDEGFKAYGGIFREECVMLLRRFYVQDNEKVPDGKVSFSSLNILGFCKGC